LRQAGRREYWLALLPTGILLLPAVPYLAFPLIMWFKAPWMMHSGWWVRFGWILAGLIFSALFSLVITHYSARRCSRRALQLLQSTDLMLYVMMQDSDANQHKQPQQGLEFDIFSSKTTDVGAFAQRLVRFAAHFDVWSKALRLRYEPWPLRTALLAIIVLPAAVAIVLIITTGIEQAYYQYALVSVVPLLLLYQHATGCGMRIGARRALMQFLTEDVL
jgi:hypothetical protein